MKKTFIIAAAMAIGLGTLQSFMPEDLVSSNPKKEKTENPMQNKFTPAEINRANTAAEVEGISDTDKAIIMYCNLARMDGAKFWSNYAAGVIGTKKTTNTESLRNDLAKIKGLKMLCPEQGLCQSAKAHAKDMYDNDFFSHNSNDGTNCFGRIGKYYQASAQAENIAAGRSDALLIVMQWLIDEGVPSLGHRKNILNPAYEAIGVCTGKHKSWGYCSVMDLGNKINNPMQ